MFIDEKNHDFFIQCHQIYRDRIRHEFDPINHRLNYLMISQYFIIVSFVVASSTKDALWLVAVVISVTGIMTAFLSKVSLDAAIQEIQGLKQQHELATSAKCNRLMITGPFNDVIQCRVSFPLPRTVGGFETRKYTLSGIWAIDRNDLDKPFNAVPKYRDV